MVLFQLIEVYGQSMPTNRVKIKVTVKLTGSTVTIIVTQVLDLPIQVYALQMLKFTCLGLVSIMLKVDASELHTCILSVHSLPHQYSYMYLNYPILQHVQTPSDNLPRYIYCGPYITSN